MKDVLPPTIFFFIGFNLILWTKRMILQEYHIEFSGFLVATGSVTDRPTITYPPLTGSALIRTLMAPIPPVRLFELIDTGYPADLLCQVAVQEVNRLANRRSGGRARAMNPAFAEVLSALRRIQDSEPVGFRIEVDKEMVKRHRLVMFFTKREVPPEIQAEWETVRKRLRLNPDRLDVLISYGADRDRDDVVAVQTRSAMQILGIVSSYISIPWSTCEKAEPFRLRQCRRTPHRPPSP